MACSSWKKLRSLIVLMQPRNGARRLLESGRPFVLNLFMYGFFVNPPFSLEWLFKNTSLSYYSLSLSNTVDTVNYKTTVKGVQVCFLSVSVTSQGPYNPLVSQYNDTAQTNILFFSLSLILKLSFMSVQLYYWEWVDPVVVDQLSKESCSYQWDFLFHEIMFLMWFLVDGKQNNTQMRLIIKTVRSSRCIQVITLQLICL